MESIIENPTAEICRLCALLSESVIYIYSAEGESKQLAHKILTCLRIEVTTNDLLTKNVCQLCIILLDELYQFCCRATEAQETLLYLPNTNDFHLSTNDNIINNLKLEGSGIKNEADDQSLVSKHVNFDELNYDTFHLEASVNENQATPPPMFEEMNVAMNKAELPIVNFERSLPLPQTRRSNLCRKERKKKDRRQNDVIVTGCQTDVTHEEQKEAHSLSVATIAEFEEESKRTSRDYAIACPTCREIFVSRSVFESHCQTVHDEHPIYACSQCDKRTDNFQSYRAHIYRHDFKFPCQYCDKKFTFEGPLRFHVLTRHVQDRPFKCVTCQKSFVTQSRLDEHVKYHDGTSYPCPHCNKILQTRSGLKAHKAAHRLGRRFQCHLCGKTFTQKVNLQEHVKFHVGDRPFSCDQCNRSFTGKSHLKRHMFYHSQERPYQCLVCNKFFKTERCVKMHTKTHEKIKAYICEECGKEFINISKLKRHSVCHTRVLQFPCRHCNRKFKSRTAAEKHDRRCNEGAQATGILLKEELIPLDSLDFLNTPSFKEEVDGLNQSLVPTIPPEASLLSQFDSSHDIWFPTEIG